MSRNAKGIALNGWLVIDKNAGYSSTAIVNKVRWLLNAKKAGHAGTLDPDATGLLAVALGEATKTIPYLTNATKTYHFQINFGSATDTDDMSGKKVKILFDKTKPNGTLRKVLNVNLAKKYGWKAKTDIEKAIRITYQDYLKKHLK